MDYYNKYRKVVVLFTIIIIMVGGAGVYLFFYYRNSNMEEVVNFIEEDIVEIEKEVELIEEVEPVRFVVDIKGMVNAPGVYELEEGKRVIDVINLAGGLKEGANTNVNNLSKKIFDEMVIIIYSNEDVMNFTKVIEEEKKEEEACKDYNSTVSNDSCITNEEDNNIKEEALDRKISINAADIDLLMSLPSVGEAKAKGIIEFRNTNGPFKQIEDIMNVSGIGEALFDKIKDYITV